MPVDTHIDQARTRVRAEREAVDAKREAFEAFADRVADIPAESTSSSARGMTVAGDTLTHGTPSHEDRCRAVRRAFAETVRPHSVADVAEPEPLLATIGSEFSESVAAALAPTTGTSFSPELRRAVVSEAATRRAEAAALCRALEREESHLDDAGTTVDDVTAWIAEADETPLPDLGFEALRQRHEALARHRDRCEGLARRRQAFLRRATNHTAEAGIRHRSLVEYLYQDFPVDHPVLATVARLDAACAECQRAVRAHLVRRV